MAVDALPDALEQNPRDWNGDYNCFAKHISDLGEFAKDVVRALNDEAEDGATMVHELFDNAMAKAIDGGSIGVDYDGAERIRKAAAEAGDGE